LSSSWAFDWPVKSGTVVDQYLDEPQHGNHPEARKIKGRKPTGCYGWKLHFNPLPGREFAERTLVGQKN
jgi:hypothetical protein